MDRQNQIRIVSDASDINDNYFKIVGPIASEILDQGGEPSLKEFCKEVKDHRGKKISYGTIQSYGYFWKRIKDLPLPKNQDDEFEFSTETLLKIARIKGDDIRKKFVQKILKETLSEEDIQFILKYR